MLARRIIAVSPDKAFGKQLAVALKAAGGAVDAHVSIDELGTGDLQAALVVLHLDGAIADAANELLARFTGDTRAIAIIPKSNLASCVDVMMASERIVALMVAEHFDGRALSALATRALAGDIFGLEKLLSWGTLVHSQLVGDYQDKSLCIAQISEFGEMMGVRRKYRESIEQCVDEMLMNALYDAPVDEQGRQIFAEIPTKTRIALRVEQKVVVQYACDGKQFAVSVRDAFGTLDRATVLRYLHKCLHAEQQIDRKAGGAGLGLYLIVNSTTQVLFNVLPGVATEATCVFDLETPKLQLEQIGFFTERIDAAGRLAAGPSRRLPGGVAHPVERRASSVAPPPPLPRGLVPALALAIVATLGLVAALAYPRVFGGPKKTTVTFVAPKGATIEVGGKSRGTASDGTLAVAELEVGRAYAVVARLDGYEPKQLVVEPRGGDRVALELAPLAATVEVDSQPPGADVIVDGVMLGQTPLRATKWKPGSTVVIELQKAGFSPAQAKLVVPDPGKQTRFVQTLAVAGELARVHLASQPSGAQVVHNGQVLAGVVTPAEVLVEAGKPQRFVLTMPHKVPAVIDAFTPARGEDIAKTGALADGATVALSANVDAKVTVAGAAHCKDLALPAECVLAPGTHEIDLVAAKVRATRKVVVADKDVTVRFEFGTVAAAPGKQIELGGGRAVQRVTLEAGPRDVVVGDDNGTHVARVVVKPGVTVIAN